MKRYELLRHLPYASLWESPMVRVSASLFRHLVLSSSHPLLLVRCFHTCRFLHLTQRDQHFLQARAGVEGQLVIRPQDVFASRQRALVHDRCFLGPALHVLKACEIIQYFSRCWML